MSEWINAAENQPRATGYYLAVVERAAPEYLGGESKRVKIMRFMGEDWRYAYHIPAWINDEIFEVVTYYMQLPEPPEDKKEGK
mgnify:CR=1 FL=1